MDALRRVGRHLSAGRNTHGLTKDGERLTVDSPADAAVRNVVKGNLVLGVDGSGGDGLAATTSSHALRSLVQWQ